MRSEMPYRTFSLEEVADYMHVSHADVEELVRTNEIPFVRQGDRVVFRKTEIDAWMSQRILGFSGGHLTAYHKKSSAKTHDLSRGHAIMPELMRPEFVESELKSKTKASVIRDMVELAGKTGLVNDPRELLDSLQERERLGTTALAGGIALLHPKNHEPYMFEDSFIVIGRTAHPIPFGSPDGSTTDLFFLICCQDDRIHLHVLARVCMMCHHTSVLLELREAAEGRDMFESLVAAEQEVIRGL